MSGLLYLIRHTAPDIAPGHCYGQLDVGLAQSFTREAQDTLHWLPPVGLVVASPLQRAHRLGELLAQEHRCPLHNDSRLMEKHFGAWEGRAWDDIPRPELDAWAANLEGYAPPGGESARQLLSRVEDFLQDIARTPQQSVAVVSHAGSIRAMLALLGDAPLARVVEWQVEYGSVTAVKL